MPKAPLPLHPRPDGEGERRMISATGQNGRCCRARAAALRRA